MPMMETNEIDVSRVLTLSQVDNWLKTKVAGFVDESLWIKTNQAFLKKNFWNKSTNWIFKVWTNKSGFKSPQIWIGKDLGVANPEF